MTLAELLLWNPVRSAPSHSTLAGVLAGVTFLGMTLVLTRQVLHTHDTVTTRAARFGATEFFLSFMTLAVASLEWGMVAGENDITDVAIRPATAEAFATMTLALGAVQLSAGLCYLAFDWETRGRPDHDRPRRALARAADP